MSSENITSPSVIPLMFRPLLCLPPGSFLPLQVPCRSAGTEQNVHPLHASDVLSARLQAIGGARTFTL